MPKEDYDDLLERVGLNRDLTSLEQVHKAQYELSRALVDAAVEAHPDLHSLSELEYLERVFENGRKRWPKLDSIVESLEEAERLMWRDLKTAHA